MQKVPGKGCSGKDPEFYSENSLMYKKFGRITGVQICGHHQTNSSISNCFFKSCKSL